MVDYKEQYKQLEKQFGELDSEELIGRIEVFIENHELDAQIKSRALSFIGSIICHLSPYLRDDCGYSYFKEALKIDPDNYDAILGICLIFNTYPYPFSKIVTEIEYLEYVGKLISDFEFLDERNKFNALETIGSYLLFRKKIINKYGYSSTLIKE